MLPLRLPYLRRAIQTIATGGFGSLLLKSLIWSLVLIVLISAGLLYVLTHITFSARPWLEWIIDTLTGVAGVTSLLFLFPALAAAMVSFFADDVAARVEQKEYPHLPPIAPVSWSRDLLHGVSMFLLVVGAGILAFPFSFFIPFLPLIVSGYLVGREYFQAVARRRISDEQVRALRRAYRGRIWWSGVVISLLSYIPVLNLLTPVVGTVYMTHFFHSLPIPKAEAPSVVMMP